MNILSRCGETKDKEGKMTIKKVFTSVSCECGHESIVIEPQDFTDLSQGIYFSIFAFAYHKPSFWHRFRHIWYTLKTGQPYTDQVCLSVDKVKELVKYLDNFITLAELETKHTNKKRKK